MRRVILILILFFLGIYHQELSAQYLFSNNCVSDKQIDVKIQGVHGQSNPSINIGNMSNITRIIVAVWIEDQDCSNGNYPNNITVSNGSQSFNVSGINIAQSPTSNASERIYRVTINNPTSSTVNISGMGTCTAASVSVQKEKTSTGRASYARAINQEFDKSSGTYTLNIGSATQARNIRVHVPIHEKSNDGRIARVEVWGNGVPLKSAQITMQTHGNEAGLIKIDLTNVPASTTQLNVKIISPTNNGDSFGVGIVTSETTSDCTPPCVSLTNGGSISGGGTFCGSFGGTKIISNTSSASGGSGGNIEYQWEYRVRSRCSNSWGSWTNWGRSGSSETWNAGNITYDHQFRRKARRNCNSSWKYSNVVTFEVDEALSSAGSISGGGTFCSNGPGNVTLSGTAPSGGCGGTIQYQWEYRNRSVCSNSWGSWTTWNGRTSQNATWNYTGTNDHQFRRKSKRSTCGNWLTSNTVTFDITSPFTNGGTISGNETDCGSLDPANITSTNGPSGGCGGSTQYQWQYRNGTSGSWANVSGATSSTYNPSTITQTRQYRRAARRSTCSSNWVYSNVVTKTVHPFITDVKLNTSKLEYCHGETATLTATVTGGSGLSYSWQYSSNGTTWINASTDPNSNVWNLTNGNLANTNRWWRVIVTGGTCFWTSHSVKTSYIPTPNISVNNKTVCVGGSATLTTTGYNATNGCFELADYASGVDRRAWTGSSNTANITAGNINHWTGCGRSNWFDIKRVGGTSGYAEYQMQFTAQNWTNYQTIQVNQCQTGNARYKVYIYDNNGWRDLGFSGTNGGTHTFNLPTNTTHKNNVSKIIVRVFAADLAANQSVRFHLNHIQVCGASRTWNTGETTASITKPPNSTTNYNVTVKYGDCSVTETGTITVVPDPAVTVQADKQALCSNQGTTLRSTVTGGTGSATYQWQWSADASSWANVSSNGTSANYNVQGHAQGTVRYWRVIVTQGTGCQTTSHQIKTTWIKTPSISVADKTVCTGSSATLTVSGYSSSEGCFNVADFRNTTTVDKRGSIASSNNSHVTIDGIWKSTGYGSGVNYFDVKRIHNGSTNAYADYNFNITQQDWSNFQTIRVNNIQSGNARYQLYIKDNSGYKNLGFSGTNGDSHTFTLPANPTDKNIVTQIKMRFNGNDLPYNQSIRAHIQNFKVCGNSISWNTGETTTSITKSPTSTTTYTATVKYGDCQQTATGKITVNPNPNLDQYTKINTGNFVLGNTVTACEGDDVILDMGGAFGSNWNFVFKRPDGTNFAGGTNGVSNDQIKIPNIQDGSLNEGTWQVTYTNPNGCTKTEDFIVIINLKPVITCEASIDDAAWTVLPNCIVSICVGGKLKLSANPNGAASYFWTGPNGFSANGNTNGDVVVSNNMTPTHAGVYTVVVTNANGCSSSKDITVNVNTGPVITCEASIDNAPFTVLSNCAVSLCEGSKLQLSTNPNGAASYAWTGPNGFSGNGNTNGNILVSNSVTPTMSGTYTVIVTNANGCPSTEQITVTVSPNPQGVLSKEDAVCGGANGSITITFPDEAGRTQIEFSLNGGNTYQTSVADNSGSVTYSGLNTGTYNVFARWGNDECPISLGAITIADISSSTLCNPELTLKKSTPMDTVKIGSTVFYTFTIFNNTGVILNNVQFTDNLANGAVYFTDPIEISGGIQVLGTTLNSSTANLTLNNIPFGTSSFKLAVDIPSTLNNDAVFCNQSQIANLTVSHPNLPNTIISDNPDTPAPSDSTCVRVKKHENCCNGLDDDGDGLCDIDDPDCTEH